MKPALGAVAALSLLFVTACGHASGKEVLHPAGGCADAAEQRPVLAQVDLSGSGTSTPVRITAADAKDCPNTLVAGDNTFALDKVDLTSVEAITLDGHKGQFLVGKQTHPRGGYQMHIYGLVGGQLTELADNGTLPVPFIATDTPGDYASVTCDQGSFVVVRAVRTGKGNTDVEQRRYDATGAQAGPIFSLGTNLSPGELAKRFPDLVHRQMFANCS